MAKDELIDAHISMNQCKRAVEALHSHEVKKDKEKEENELLGPTEQAVWLVLAVKKMHPERRLKPFRIPVQHPIVDPRTTGVCLICKDPQREYKDLLQSHGIKFISRVVGVTKLKGKFKPYEARRMLLKDHGLFLADERVIPLLPRLLGKKWFEAKKQPIPVCLTRKDLKRELERAINSTYMHQNQGTCTSVRIGTLSHTPSQILANITTAVPAIASTIKGGWENIQSLYIKTHSSVSLPIWTCNLDDSDAGRWNGLATGVNGSVSESASNADGSTSSTSGDEDEVPVQTARHRQHGHGKKTKVTEDDEPQNIKNKAAGGAVSPQLKQTHKRQLGANSSAATLTRNAETRSVTKTHTVAKVDEPPFKKHKTTKDDAPVLPKKTRRRDTDSTGATVAEETKEHPAKTNTGKRKPESPSLSNPGGDHRHKTSLKAVKATSSESSIVDDVSESVSRQKATRAPTRTAEAGDRKKKIGLVERKKMKLLHGRLGRTAKNAVLGKRTARE